MNYFRLILGIVIITIVGIVSIIYWNKNIDSETTQVYGIYVAINIILSVFVLIGLELYWTAQV